MWFKANYQILRSWSNELQYLEKPPTLTVHSINAARATSAHVVLFKLARCEVVVEQDLIIPHQLTAMVMLGCDKFRW
jgi:hypothetical protein